MFFSSRVGGVLVARALRMNMTTSFTNAIFNITTQHNHAAFNSSLGILSILTTLDGRIASASVIAGTIAVLLVIRYGGRRAAPAFDAPLHVCSIKTQETDIEDDKTHTQG